MGFMTLHVDCWENKAVVWPLDEDGFSSTKTFAVLEDSAPLCALDEEEAPPNTTFAVVAFSSLLSLDGPAAFSARGTLVGRDPHNLAFSLNKSIAFTASSFFDFS